MMNARQGYAIRTTTNCFTGNRLMMKKMEFRVIRLKNAEARFAVGVVQALMHNTSEPLLDLWLNDVVAALAEAREARQEITEANSLDKNPDLSPMQRADLLPTNAEKRLYLSSCWLEALCTAEARVLGWIYLKMYGKPFSPKQ